MTPVLILHGGAGKGFTSRTRADQARKKIAAILDKAYSRLLQTNALEAVCYAVRMLEDDPSFNAGTGSQLQADGRARLSASVMDGFAGRFAGIVNVEKVKNPVLAARALLLENDRVLAADGALKFARKHGLETGDTRTAAALRRWRQARTQQDTVGACALDRDGRLASATSTGGKGCERPGRVSDSAMPVANYATRACAVSVSGIGEEIMEEGVAVKIATRVADGCSLARAFRNTFAEIRASGRRMGAIAVDSIGNLRWDTSTELLVYAWRRGRKSGFFKARPAPRQSGRLPSPSEKSSRSCRTHR